MAPEPGEIAPVSAEAGNKTPDTSTNVCVAVHVRPLLHHETAEGCQECLYTVPGQPQVSTQTKHSFKFDSVFGSSATPSSQLFGECVLPLVDGLFKGYNATVLAYGQTGSGKTYTMGSAFAPGVEQEGVIPKVMETLFSRMVAKKQTADFTVRVGFVEIHKEEIRDLLVEPGAPRPNVTVREVPNGGGVCLAGAQEREVASYTEMAEVLEKGTLFRATAATNMNAKSSRSHAIFTITLEQRKRPVMRADAPVTEGEEDLSETDEDADAEDDFAEDEYLCAKMHLVDLAGSERAKRTGAEGQRLKEGIHINKGLLALGNVISALCDEQRVKAGSHVPYRDSKLTRLLQDSLGGNSRTCMIACVSPADINLEETLNTLKYAARARNIRNTPVVNRDANSAQVTHLKQQLAAARAEVACLKKELHGQGRGFGGADSASGGDALMQAAMEELEAQVSSKDKEVERLRVEKDALRKEADENHARMLSAQAERDILHARLGKAKEAGFVEPEGADGADLDMPLIEAKLAQIARLESENRRLKQLQHLSSAYFTARRQSGTGMTPGAASQGMLSPGGAMGFGASPGQFPMTPGSFPMTPGSFAADFNDEDLEEQSRTSEHDRLGRELLSLQGALEEKEKLLRELQEKSKVSKLKETYEKVLKEATAENEELSKERSKLLKKLQSMKVDTVENRKRLEEKYRSRIRELELKMKAASQKAASAARYEKMKCRIEEKCSHLEAEIRSMRQQKVALTRAVEASHKEMNAYKRARDKELAQAKRAGMKSAAEVQRLSAMQAKQAAVLKRKTEEAEMARKRLRELGAGSKANAKKMRDAMASTLAKQDAKTEESRRQWIEKELEACNQVQDLQRVRDGETAQRAECKRHLDKVREQLKQLRALAGQGASPISGVHGPNEAKLENEEKSLNAKYEEHNKQVVAINDKIEKAKAEEASKKSRDERDLKRWEFIRTVPDARIMLRTVFRAAEDQRNMSCEVDSCFHEKCDELSEALVELQISRQECEAAWREVEILKRSAAAADVTVAAVLGSAADTSSAHETVGPAVEPVAIEELPAQNQDDEELEELLQQIDTLNVEMTGGGNWEDSSSDAAIVLQAGDGQFGRNASAAFRYSHEDGADEADESFEEEEEDEDEEGYTSEDEDETEEDGEESDPTWDLAQATPNVRASSRRRNRNSSDGASRRSRGGGSKWDHWQHPASAGSSKAPVLAALEAQVLRAVNASREHNGQDGVERLTVPIIKEFLKGRTIDGEPWRCGQKTRSQLLEDCAAALGLTPSTPLGSGASDGGSTPSTGTEATLSAFTPLGSVSSAGTSHPPETPTVTLRGLPPHLAGSSHKSTGLTPSTAEAAASAQRYLQQATLARERAKKLAEFMDSQRSSASFEARPSLSPPAFLTPDEVESRDCDSDVGQPSAKAADVSAPAPAQEASGEAILAPRDVNSPHNQSSTGAVPKRRLLGTSDNHLPMVDGTDF